MALTPPTETTDTVGLLRALGRLLPFLRPVLPRLLLGTVAALISALLSLATPTKIPRSQHSSLEDEPREAE